MVEFTRRLYTLHCNPCSVKTYTLGPVMYVILVQQMIYREYLIFFSVRSNYISRMNTKAVYSLVAVATSEDASLGVHL